MRFLPPSATPTAKLILITRGMRALADGCISVLLPAYLLALGFDALQVGVLTTATLLGSAVLTLAVGFYGTPRRLSDAAARNRLLMLATGIGFAAVHGFWPLLLVAFVGTLNPSAGDVSVFLPLEQAALSGAVADRRPHRCSSPATAWWARCSARGGALLARPRPILPAVRWLGSRHRRDAGDVPRSTPPSGSLAGADLPPAAAHRRRSGETRAAPLGPSRGIVLRLAALFSVDAFAGGFVVQSLLALWLFERSACRSRQTAAIFFWTGLLSAFSYLIAARIAAPHRPDQHHGLHAPAGQPLPDARAVRARPRLAVALLLVRSLLSQMDVPTRTSYVMAVVTPAERPAAASVTAVPRSLASALGPTLGGLLLAASPFGWPLVLGGALKTVYDLALLLMFRHVKPPEEQRFTAD